MTNIQRLLTSEKEEDLILAISTLVTTNPGRLQVTKAIEEACKEIEIKEVHNLDIYYPHLSITIIEGTIGVYGPNTSKNQKCKLIEFKD